MYDIPIIYNENYGYIIRFNDLEYINEYYGLDYNDGIQYLLEENEINEYVVAIDESEIIINPEVVNELRNIIIIPISENNIIYQFYEDCIDAYIESGNKEYLLFIENINEAVNIIKKLRKECNINKRRPNIIKSVFNTKKVHEENNPRINIFTGNINYLHENNILNYDIKDFIGPNREERMKRRIELTAKKIIDKNTKSIAQKIAALHRLGNQLKGKEEYTYDLEKKGRIQRAFDTVKNKAKELLNKITPSFLK